MAASPRFKLFNPEGEYVASFKHAEDAACLLALYGEGAILRWRDRRLVLWREGKETQPAGESYDHVADVVHRRLDEARREQAGLASW